MGPIKFTLIKRLKTNNHFNYTPRYFKGKEGADEVKSASKFDAYQDVYNSNDFSGQWRDARIANRNRNNGGLNATIVIVALALILLFLFIIDFDLSIFSQK
ncbi:hypothetical protein [Ulvibacter antarcticus]|uniref:Riboflavin synthase subunit beta n=1 Tax=Ulvibacter antarcticus TaxID=442714 RepID=A0A3L9ZDV4_9FLAO|nr:hypothetical protein [Ulvibacter antarcticus]RMA64852.1 hypothetical protein BXY75_1737 [Ulvibacter antarcticus]